MHLGNAALHDEEVGIVDIELDALEEVLNTLLGRLVAVEEVLGYVGKRDLRETRSSVRSDTVTNLITNLTSDCDLLEVLHPHWAPFTVGVVEDDGDACFGDACLASLVDEVLLILCTHLKGYDYHRGIH